MELAKPVNSIFPSFPVHEGLVGVGVTVGFEQQVRPVENVFTHCGSDTKSDSKEVKSASNSIVSTHPLTFTVIVLLL